MAEEYCKECGKKFGFLDKRVKSSGYCAKCVAKKIEHCEKCGKKLSFWKGQQDFALQHNFMCQDCWSSNEFKKTEANNVCINCAYSVRRLVEVEKASVTNVFAALTGLPEEYETLEQWSCIKFGFDLTGRLNLAEECTSFITVKEYERKCLRGELDSDLVTCQYCQARYDRVKQIRCPNCGAYPKGKQMS
jgi:hypothetical protein